MIRDYHIFAISVSISLGTLWAMPVSAQLLTPELLARTGTEGTLGPNLGAGQRFSGFLPPVVDASGRVGFAGSVLASGSARSGAWTWTRGVLSPQLVSGQAAPGIAGATIADVGTVVIARNDQLAFLAKVTGSGITNSTDTLVYAGSSREQLRVAAREGIAGVGDLYTPTGTIELPDFAASLLLNDQGQVAFVNRPAGTGTNRSLYFSDPSGALTLIVPTGGNFGNSSNLLQNTYLSSRGTLIFPGQFINQQSVGLGSWSSSTGLRGQPIFGVAAPGVQNGYFSGGSTLPSGIDYDRTTMFMRDTMINLASSTLGPRGVWSWNGQELTNIAIEGQAATGLGSGITIGRISTLNQIGTTECVFGARLVGNGVTNSNDQSLWISRDAGITLVARKGDQAPGTGLGTLLSFDGGGSSNYLDWSANSNGQVALLMKVIGSGVNSNNDIGIWAWDASSGLQLVVRTGQTIDLGDGMIRTITALKFRTGVSDTGGRRSGFAINDFATGYADRGILVYGASFSDGSQAVFRVAVPVPGSAIVVGLVGTLSLRRTRRKCA